LFFSGHKEASSKPYGAGHIIYDKIKIKIIYKKAIFSELQRSPAWNPEENRGKPNLIL
jgi:hypothetical protein